MRKFVGSTLAVAALVGTLGFSGSAAAATPQSTQSTQGTTATTAPQDAGDFAAAAPQCVKAKKWFNKRFNRYVKVKNSCNYKVCFKVDLPASRDPEFAIGKRKTEDFRYGGIAWTKGRKVYRSSC
ncbi:hypothetical protein [Streptomyces sp. NPDC017940]|uniref:hypothetical protein n=1 Tax=Streptomyces sp. NPDC017940 TaxID=3365017 RepID=UPI0037A296BE